MSKKMLKRSLALGALMAFVITGSAMAEEVYFDGNNNPYTETVFEYSNTEIANLANNFYGNNGDMVLKANTSSYNGFSYHFRSYGVGNSATVTDLNSITISGTYDTQRGPFLGINSGTLNLGTKTEKIDTIKTAEDAIVGIVFNAQKGTINVNADKIDIRNTLSNAVYAHDLNGSVSITANDIYISGKRAACTDNDGSVGNNIINIVGNNSVTLAGTNGGALRAYSSGGQINVDGKYVHIIGVDELDDGDDYAIFAQGGGVVNVGENLNSATTERVVVEGMVYTKTSGEVSLNLGTNGSLTGKTEIVDGNGTINLNLGTNSTWDASGTGASNKVTTLSGIGSVIVGEDDAVEAGTVSETVTVEASAEYANVLAEDGEISKEEMEVLQEQLTGAKNAMVGETALTGVTTLTEDGGYTSNANVSNVGIRDMAGLALVAWRAENNDMNKRLGELRNADGEHGVWVRMVRGESEYSTVKNQYNTYQLGYDEKLSTDKSWTVGMALSYTDGESSFERGNGENTSKAVAFYGSKLNADGSFVDLIAKYARIENEYDITGGVGGAEYDANGYSVSAEYGKRFEQGNGLWIEPQVELTYGKVGSADYVTKKGYKVAQDSMESLVGRIGFSLGKDVKGGNVYARASYLYDFDGETELTFADKVKMDQDLGGGWWEVGVGANINLSKATYIYADVEKTFGGEVDTNWQWNLGVRYSF